MTMAITHPDQIHRRFLQAVNAKDADAVLAMYDPDAVNVELDGSQTTGRDALRASFTGLVGAVRHIEGGTRKIFVAGDIALTSGTWTAEFVLPDGSVIEQQGTSTEVSRRQPDGTWRIVIDDPMFV
jgi:uncharacterized protein (TIGR02246 family)